MTSHRTGTAAAIFLRNTVPVVLAWIGASRLLATYRPPAFTSLFATWALAVPAGIVVRSAIAGSLAEHRFWVFLGVAMAFTLLSLGVGRVVALAIARSWKVR